MSGARGDWAELEKYRRRRHRWNINRTEGRVRVLWVRNNALSFAADLLLHTTQKSVTRVSFSFPLQSNVYYWYCVCILDIVSVYGLVFSLVYLSIRLGRVLPFDQLCAAAAASRKPRTTREISIPFSVIFVGHSGEIVYSFVFKFEMRFEIKKKKKTKRTMTLWTDHRLAKPLVN